MSPETKTQSPTDKPDIAQPDWDEIESGALLPQDVPQSDDLEPDDDADGEIPEEDDDNPYQESDEALPDDEDERVISRNPSKEGGRFDDV